MIIYDYTRVAIIGCGLIGTEWDRNAPPDSPVLTHARAFSQHPRAQLVALCDRDADRARNAAKYWQVPNVYADPKLLFAEQKIDLVVVATPSMVRSQVIEPALDAGVNVLVIEKPLATTLDESLRLVSAITAAGCNSIVNYSRNWDPSIRDIQKKILSGKMGRIQRVIATYGKGLGNNASHLIDLTSFLCDSIPVRARSLGSPLDVNEAEWSRSVDRALDAQVEFISSSGSSVNLTILGTDHREFTSFDMRVIGQSSIFEFTMGGRHLSWADLQEDPDFDGYVVPAPAQPLSPGYFSAMEQMAEEAIQLAEGNRTTATSNVHTALRTAYVIDAIQRSAQSNDQWITLPSLSTFRIQ